MACAACRERAAIRRGEMGFQDQWDGGRAAAVDMAGISRVAASRSDLGSSLRDAIEKVGQSMEGVLFSGPVGLVAPQLYAWKSVKWVRGFTCSAGSGSPSCSNANRTSGRSRFINGTLVLRRTGILGTPWIPRVRVRECKSADERTFKSGK